MAQNDVILARAEFDPRLPRYFMLQALAGMLFSFVMIPLIPFWLILGRGIHQQQYKNLVCELTPRTLKVRRGVLFKVQKSIPLDKITDLALNEGPILRYLGLCSLTIETAGGGQGAATGQAVLPGVANAEEFRDRVLEQRDRVTLRDDSSERAAAVPAVPMRESGTLDEIRDILVRIDQRLADRA
ncbi:PH domain-containing protein [Engelhardtia mirabilis]|uniref:Bacterial membrane flanked domain protein n=1 Tax=Engelhardtia mirabilis TaxID=2528011 RepID=A0A518BDX9_9BACT|nr:Bacterial membrane flanked domain protein [Planctomycetes bacterium Pla133]QDU99498.1 Bacterial membrane flanked domain protein [Planctomycetes bacterium Pla86]